MASLVDVVGGFFPSGVLSLAEPRMENVDIFVFCFLVFGGGVLGLDLGSKEGLRRERADR